MIKLKIIPKIVKYTEKFVLVRKTRFFRFFSLIGSVSNFDDFFYKWRKWNEEKIEIGSNVISFWKLKKKKWDFETDMTVCSGSYQRLKNVLLSQKISAHLIIWLYGKASSTEKKLWQASSRRMKIAQKDWNGVKSFKELHKESKRATPKMWSNYLHCCALYDVVN